MPETVPETPRRPIGRLLLVGSLIGLSLAVLAELAYILVGTNLREVRPGELYRCAQPEPGDLARARERFGIRTVVALRGTNDFEAWYRQEIATAEEQGLSLEVLPLAASRLPSMQSARRLCEILEEAEPPLLVHCQRGVDRTGLVCAMYLLLRTNVSLETARSELTLRYLHLNAGRTRAMGQFFDLYADWLGARGESHQPERFRHWVQTEYRPPQGSARLELVASPGTIRLNEPQRLSVRVWNETRHEMTFSPGLLGGVYLRWALFKADRSPALPAQPGGLRELRLAPGASANLNVYLPPIAQPGRYFLKIDLFDQLVGSFAVYGSDPLFVELDVR